MTQAITLTRNLLLLVTMLLTLSAVLLPAAPALGQAIQGEETTETDGPRFQSDRARQHMLELEERMFNLASRLRETQPEDAQRLTMAMNRSRNEQLVDRMNTVSGLIGELHLSDANSEVRDIITQLNEIKRLLLTADLQTALDLERLEQINNALEALSEIEAQEAANQGQSDRLSEEDSPNAQAMEGVGQAESRNGEATERLEGEVGEINPQDPNLQAAEAALNAASESMSQAAGQLGQGMPGEASDSQSEAREELDNAREALETARDELRQELERRIRAMVLENLRAMLKQQTAIREQLEIVSEEADLGVERAVIQVRAFVPAEQEIIVLAEDTVDLCEQTAFSVAMPAALSAVRGRMEYLVDDYDAGRGGQRVVTATRQVEADLSSLIDAMQQSNANQDPTAAADRAG